MVDSFDILHPGRWFGPRSAEPDSGMTLDPSSDRARLIGLCNALKDGHFEARPSQADELDVSTLAHRSYLMRESLSRILRDLGERGLIVRRVSSSDARRFCHTLTAKGRHLLEEVSPDFNPVYKEIEARVGVERIEDLNRRLAELLAYAHRCRALEFPRRRQANALQRIHVVRGPQH